MIEQGPITVSIGMAGRHFAEVAHRNLHFTVVAKFTNVIHIIAGDDYGCLCGAGLPRDPLNACVVGSIEDIHAAVAIGQIITVDVCQAQNYTPLKISEQVSPKALLERIAVTRSRAATSAPADGLARPALGLSVPASALTKLAVPRLETFKSWLRTAAPRSDRAPTDLVGFGPGLTPSGDDFICGALIALHACGRRSEADALGTAAIAAARNATTQFSRALIKSAMEGEATEPLHRVVNAILGNDPIPLELHLAKLTTIGHTSGWDALAGVIVALEAEVHQAQASTTTLPPMLTSLQSP